MMRTIRDSAVLCAALCCLLPAHVRAEAEENAVFFRGHSFYTGLHLEYWNFLQTHTVEAILPLYLSMDLGKLLAGTAVDMVTSPLYAGHSGPVESDGIVALAGTKLRASWNLRDVMLATVGVQVPTGNNELSAAQQRTEGAIATPQFSEKINRVRAGFNLNVTLSGGLPLGDNWVLGASAGYLMTGAYSTAEQNEKFNPGDEICVTLGADWDLPPSRLAAAKLTGDAVATFYTADRFGDNTVHDPAVRFAVNLRSSVKNSRGYANVNVLTVNFAGTERDVRAGDTVESNLGNEYVLNSGHYFPSARNLRPHLLARLRGYTTDSRGSGGAFLGGIGGGVAPGLGRKASLNAQALVECGGLNGGFIFGVEISGGVKYAF